LNAAIFGQGLKIEHKTYTIRAHSREHIAIPAERKNHEKHAVRKDRVDACHQCKEICDRVAAAV
jgi:hypothetical protein